MYSPISPGFDQHSNSHVAEPQSQTRSAVIRTFPNRILQVTVFSSCNYNKHCPYLDLSACTSACTSFQREETHKRTALELSEEEEHSQACLDCVASTLSSPRCLKRHQDHRPSGDTNCLHHKYRHLVFTGLRSLFASFVHDLGYRDRPVSWVALFLHRLVAEIMQRGLITRCA
jgi:hypothetical protein